MKHPLPQDFIHAKNTQNTLATTNIHYIHQQKNFYNIELVSKFSRMPRNQLDVPVFVTQLHLKEFMKPGNPSTWHMKKKKTSPGVSNFCSKCRMMTSSIFPLIQADSRRPLLASRHLSSKYETVPVSKIMIKVIHIPQMTTQAQAYMYTATMQLHTL
jgi:hypothetical protein